MSLIGINYRVLNYFNATGIPMLVNSATPVSCSSASPSVVFTAAGSAMSADPYDFQPKYPLLLKLFFTNVVMTGTIAYPNPEFIVNISGPKSFTCHRVDEKDFALAIRIKDWSTLTLDTTVSINALPTLTGVTFSCIAGLATDTQDTASEF